MRTIKIDKNLYKLIDLYVETDFSERKPRVGSCNHFTVYVSGLTYACDYGEEWKMQKYLDKIEGSKVIWLRNLFYDD